MLDLTGRRILITGASSGIGRELVILMDRLGASVVACGRDEARLCDTLASCRSPKKHLRIVFELKDFGRYASVFEEAVANGKLDGLVHCAGIAQATPLRGLSVDVVRDILDVNLISFFQLAALYAKRKYNNGGSIVGISAVNAHYPQKCMSAYAASKLALEGATKTMAVELADQGIRINCVVPGGIDTPMGKDVLPETREYLSHKPLLGMCKPEDVNYMVAFLLSDFSKQITGRSMYVDGGWLGQ